jgi:hypothetical protein
MNSTKSPGSAAVDAQQLTDAESLLFRTIGIVDSTTGRTICRRVETAEYHDYRERRAAFMAARAVYTAAYKQAQATPEGRRAWPALAVQLTVPVEAAQRRLHDAGSAEIEQAEALLERAAVQSRRAGP